MTITTKQLISNIANRKEIKEEFTTRDEYLMNKKFGVGDFVEDKVSGLTGEIILRGSNYVTVVSEGKEYRWWLSSLKETHGESKRNQMYKESFIFKGYKTKNLTRELSEQFKLKSKEISDQYALLSCLKCCDYIAGVDTDAIIENFSQVKVQLDRAKRYSSRFSINISEQLEHVEENCLKFAILENHKFTTTDAMMIARLIASVAEVNAEGADPTAIVNKSIVKFKNSQLNTAGWELLGRMLNVATDAGIKWNKSAFGSSEQKMMKLN